MSLITVISDIHVGHPAAIWPSKHVTDQNVEIHANAPQKVLLQYWDDFFSQQDVKDSEYILNLEESIEGYNRKEHGSNIMITSLEEQIKAFVALLAPKIPGKKYLCVEGSRYHGSQDTQVGKTVGDKFGGTYMGVVGNWRVGDTGRSIHCTHKSGDAALYKTMTLDRNSLYMSAIKSKVKFDPDIMLYGHHHQYFRVDTQTRINVMAPCWKFWHPIKDGSRYTQTQPSIGGLVLKVSKEHVEVDKYLYPLEHVYDAFVEV